MVVEKLDESVMREEEGDLRWGVDVFVRYVYA